MTDAVLVETDADGVATITFNRPERRNGWAEDLADAYDDALAAAARDETVRAVVVTGAGTTFCPGADMSDLRKSRNVGLAFSASWPALISSST